MFAQTFVAAPALIAVVAQAEPIDSHLAHEAWWDGFSQGSDGIVLEIPADLDARLHESWRAGHWSGFDNFETEQLAAAALVSQAEAEAEYLGFQLGADGVDAELMTPHDDERAAFERGLYTGDDELWRVDPLYASFVKERNEAAR